MPRLSKIGAACLAAFGYTQGTATIAANILVVAGGGSGASNAGAGSGGGGLLTSIINLSFLNSYSIIVGAGGAATIGAVGAIGGNSSISGAGITTITATGGGGGGNFVSSTGGNGGSGGGGGAATGATTSGGTGISGQGNAGGTGNGVGTGGAGGGGGANAVGGNGTSTNGGVGGAGFASSISGSSVTYAGGGGGSAGVAGLGGAGGVGGGGAGGGGATNPAASGISGTANLGGGGGGGWQGGGVSIGGKGGSGVVIVSYTSPTQIFGGGIVTFVGGNWIHTFTTSGTLVPISTFTASYLLVAGGGAGGGGIVTGSGGGGGGAGGFVSGTGLTLDTNSNYIVTVGAGGTGTVGIQGTNGGTSNISSIVTSTGGGGGGNSTFTGLNGGSGGGGYKAGAGTGVAGQGNAGAQSINGSSGSGGGGASAAGISSSVSPVALGNGGNGSASSLSGASVTYAGGGGGGRYNVETGGAGTGGTGGGGNGGSASVGTAGTANTGGGGGGGAGGSGAAYAGGAGGSGIVIISYAGAQRMAGGNVTFVGGNTIHTFTSSGYLSALKLIDRSLRFKQSTSSYLNRTPASAGNRKTWTYSVWLKRGNLDTGALQTLLAGLFGSNSDRLLFETSTTCLTMYGDDGVAAELRTTQVFRDPSAWYHIVFASDTTQAIASNRWKLYVNGVQVTSFSTANYPALNRDGGINNNTVQRIGAPAQVVSQFFDGYMTEINFVDGQALTPSSFGGYNSFGVWQPTQYLGSYGTNGFYLPFTNNTSSTTIGFDFSPNQNNWTANGFTLTPTTSVLYDSMTDVPTLTSETASNWCIANSLDAATNLTISDGNLKLAASASGSKLVRSSFALPDSGAYYAEITFANSSTSNIGQTIGICTASRSLTATFNAAGAYLFYASNFGNLVSNGTTNASLLTTISANELFQVAIDVTNSKMWIGRTNVWYNSTGGTTGNPSTGANPTFTGAFVDYFIYAGFDTTSAVTANINFGQRPFVGTVPTGFVALNTFNM